MDEIALSMGFDGDSPCRTEAAITYELTHNLGNGHVFLPRDKLIAATAQLIDLPADRVEITLDELIERKVIVQEQVANVLACYLRRMYEAETFVAQRLLAMVKAAVRDGAQRGENHPGDRGAAGHRLCPAAAAGGGARRARGRARHHRRPRYR